MRRRKILKLGLIFGVSIKKALITLIRRQEQVIHDSHKVPAMLEGMFIKTVPHKPGWIIGSNNTPNTTTCLAKLQNIRAKLISRVKARVPPAIKRFFISKPSFIMK